MIKENAMAAHSEEGKRKEMVAHHISEGEWILDI